LKLLEVFDASHNLIEDISSLSGMIFLETLTLNDNQISDIHVLIDNEGIGDGDVVNLSDNLLGMDDLEDLEELEARGVDLTYSICGNGEVEGEEECDDGNEIDDDECSNSCEEVSPPDESLYTAALLIGESDESVDVTFALLYNDPEEIAIVETEEYWDVEDVHPTSAEMDDEDPYLLHLIFGSAVDVDSTLYFTIGDYIARAVITEGEEEDEGGGGISLNIGGNNNNNNNNGGDDDAGDDDDDAGDDDAPADEGGEEEGDDDDENEIPIYQPPAPRCGDLLCNGSETCGSCARDCGPCQVDLSEEEEDDVADEELEEELTEEEILEQQQEEQEQEEQQLQEEVIAELITFAD